MKAIVAVDKNWGIGNKGRLLFSIKEDMKFFKEMTTGHMVVMGSKTFESIGKELPNRENVIISRSPMKYTNRGLVAYNKDEFDHLRHHDDTNNIFIIGGAEIYNTYMADCDVFYITHIDAEAEADAFIDANRLNAIFYMDRVIKSGEQDGIKWKICEYHKK